MVQTTGDAASTVSSSPRRRQVNIWLTEAEFRFLQQVAQEREQSVSGLIRRAIAVWRSRQTQSQHTNLVP